MRTFYVSVILAALALGWSDANAEGQKLRISTYQIQARYELAAIYDRASNDKPKAKP